MLPPGGARDSALEGGVGKKKAEKSSAGTGKTKASGGVRSRRQSSSPSRSSPEVFESDGLQFRRSTDDAKELLKQMREGSLGDDPLMRANEYMDSDEVDDWGALYDGKSSGMYTSYLSLVSRYNGTRSTTAKLWQR